MFDDVLRICATSFNALLGDCKGNLERIAEEAARAAEAGAKLLATPEMSICGHGAGPENKEPVEPLRGPSLETLTALARKHGLVISAGIAEESPSPDGWPYNTQVLVGPEGLISKQRKLHLSGNENCFNHPGEIVEHAEIGAWRIGTAICYDNNFPELHRILALRGCELLLAPHAARIGHPDGQDLARHKVKSLAWARTCLGGAALANAAFTVYANQTGNAGRCRSNANGGWVVHAGGVAVYRPSGEVLAQGPETEAVPERIVVEVDRREATARRAKNHFSLNFRRAALFGELTDPDLVARHRARFGVAPVGEWWAEEQMQPARIP
ncbi:MAG: hypothetical protein M5U26_02330 [Planctomycetota bacterium]|nr:hypothetical protein [Planctomycetota bacterium]